MRSGKNPAAKGKRFDISGKEPLLFLLLTVILALSGLGIYAAAQPKEEDEMPEATLIVATDLHYIAPELTDHGAYFTRVIEQSDGKVMQYI